MWLHSSSQPTTHTGQTWGQINVFVSVFKYANLHFNIIKDPVFVGRIQTFYEIHTKYSNMHNLVDFISFFNHFRCITKLSQLMQSVSLLLSHAIAPNLIHRQHSYFKLKSSYICSSLFYLHFEIERI